MRRGDLPLAIFPVMLADFSQYKREVACFAVTFRWNVGEEANERTVH